MTLKKLLAIFLLLCLPAPALAALNFAANTTQRASAPNSASIQNLSALTVYAWIFPTAIGTDQHILTKASEATGAGGPKFFIHNGDVFLSADRATTDLAAQSSGAPVTANNWWFVAGTYTVGGANSDQRLFLGSLTGTVAELPYTTQTAGSGSQVNDSTRSLTVGNIGAGATWGAFRGRIAVIGLWNRALTPGELAAQQFRPHKTSGCVGLWFLGYNGTGTQADWSGNGNHLTVTGATVGDHAPLGPFVGWDWRKNPLDNLLRRAA